MFVDSTPHLSVVLANPLLELKYPQKGTVQAAIDTGFSGFVMVPGDVFHELGLDQLVTETRTLILADGSRVASIGAYGSVDFSDVRAPTSGFVETMGGMEEILLGDLALRSTTLELNYCLRRVTARRCK